MNELEVDLKELAPTATDEERSLVAHYIRDWYVSEEALADAISSAEEDANLSGYEEASVEVREAIQEYMVPLLTRLEALADFDELGEEDLENFRRIVKDLDRAWEAE